MKHHRKIGIKLLNTIELLDYRFIFTKKLAISTINTVRFSGSMLSMSRSFRVDMRGSKVHAALKSI